MFKLFKLNYFFCFFWILIILSGCKDEITNNYYEEIDKSLPVVITGNIKVLSSNFVISEGYIETDNGKTILSKGICWSTKKDPTINNFKTEDGEGAESFSSKLTDLEPKRGYYYRAYATNENGTSYGNILSFETLSTVKDIDGNEYNMIKIGDQIWMAENLKTTRTRSGASVNYVDYNNEHTNSNVYGYLYDRSSILTSDDLAPEGWHIPTTEEWEKLIINLGGISIAGGKMKEAGFEHWDAPNIGASNESCFTALPAGYAYYNYYNDAYEFYGLRKAAMWWTYYPISSLNEREIRVAKLYNNSMYIMIENNNTDLYYYSIRCIRNEL